jgi:hypothetical protein
MNHSLVNKDFERSITKLRRILPSLSFGLLVGIYFVSALIMGIFHAQSASELGLKVAGFLITFAIQAGRGTLVFFFQLNPVRIQTHYWVGLIAATALLLLSLWEGYLVMWQYGLSWTVAVSSLMLIGWIIELMILRETMFASQIELYQNQDQWIELHKYFIARNEFKKFMRDLKSGKTPVLPVPPEPEQNDPELTSESESKNEPEKDRIAEENEEEDIPGKVERPSLNGHQKH